MSKSLFAMTEEELNRPLKDACGFCGSSHFDSLHSLNGCRFCTQQSAAPLAFLKEASKEELEEAKEWVRLSIERDIWLNKRSGKPFPKEARFQELSE